MHRETGPPQLRKIVETEESDREPQGRRKKEEGGRQGAEEVGAKGAE